MSVIRFIGRAFVGLVALFLAAGTAHAGPPFMTDDPEPTEQGHWEIYAPLIEVEGRGGAFSGAVAVEVNYGAAKDVQLTIELPTEFAHQPGAGWQWGAGDVAVSAKYRFINDEASGVQVAVFPGLTLPTGTNGMGAGRVTALLPVWAQKDMGKWSVFGGGGYAINPGPGNRNYWTGGMAVAHQATDNLLLGAEVTRQGASEIGGAGSTRLGLATIYDLKGPLRLLASGGPTFEDGQSGAGYHAFVALGVDF